MRELSLVDRPRVLAFIHANAKHMSREGLRYARSVPDLWVPLIMMAVVGTLSYNFQVVFPLFVLRDLGGDESTFTLLFSVVSVGALVGALAVAPSTGE